MDDELSAEAGRLNGETFVADSAAAFAAARQCLDTVEQRASVIRPLGATGRSDTRAAVERTLASTSSGSCGRPEHKTRCQHHTGSRQAAQDVRGACLRLSWAGLRSYSRVGGWSGCLQPTQADTFIEGACRMSLAALSERGC